MKMKKTKSELSKDDDCNRIMNGYIVFRHMFFLFRDLVDRFCFTMTSSKPVRVDMSTRFVVLFQQISADLDLTLEHI